MGQRIKIKELCAEGFRGILKKVWLDFGDDCKSLVLFGNNGDGKSSFSDALSVWGPVPAWSTFPTG